MITRWKLRLAATAVTLATVVHPAASHAEPTMIANRPATTHMDHISVEAVGAGSPVILVPGLSSPRAVWDGVTPTLARTHRVYLIQINGFAGEAPGANLGPGMLDGVVADIDALIVRQRMSKPALVGHSLGGLVGLMIARAHPDHIGRLMIVDALPFVGALFGPTATVEMVRPQAAAMRDMMARTQEDAAARSANAEKVASQMTLTRAAHDKVVTWATAADPRVASEAMYEDLTTDMRPAMATFTTPITLVYPWNAALPKATAEALYKREYADAPSVAFVDVPDAAHFAMLDQPVVFQGALTTFLEK